MTMKKVLLALVAVLLVTSVSAQKWSVGGRVGSGFQAVGQWHYNEKCNIEARFGASWTHSVFAYGWDYGIDGDIDILAGYTSPITADFTVLHNWRVLEMDWTPKAGEWFLDAGVGLNVAGAKHVAYIGAAGLVRLGFTFNKVPLTLGVDYTPIVGPAICYVPGYESAAFNVGGLANFGVSCTYNF